MPGRLIVIGPYHLRHDGADGVELTCIHFDSRPAGQPNDKITRGPDDRHRAENVLVLRDWSPSCRNFGTVHI